MNRDHIQRSPAGTGPRRDRKPTARWLRDYLRASFYLGKLSNGDRLPSHRELAKQLGISSATALELYHTLESEGILRSKERSGTFLRDVASERDRNARHKAVFGLITRVVARLDLLMFSPVDYAGLVRRYAGADTRPDFKFGFVMKSEAFELASSTIERSCRTPLPRIRLSPNPDDAAWAKTLVARDRTIKCLVATYLHFELAIEIARQFDRHVVLARPEQSADAVFEIAPRTTRYLVTRDPETAADLRVLISKIFGPPKADQFVVASLGDDALMHEIEERDDPLVVAPMAYAAARARFGPTRRLDRMPSNVSPDTIESMVFHYLFTGTDTPITAR